MELHLRGSPTGERKIGLAAEGITPKDTKSNQKIAEKTEKKKN